MPPKSTDPPVPTGLAVFINCPFDEQYRPIFEAVVFAVHRCGFLARCALEDGSSDAVRIDKIVRLIGECQLGIHDLSRVDTEGKLPRFNMPFELGVFVGAQHYRTESERPRGGLILELERYQHQKFLSDLSGNDFEAHRGKSEEAVSAVRKFLSGHSEAPVPGRDRILRDYEFFRTVLPTLLQEKQQDMASLTFREFRGYVSDVVTLQVSAPGTPQ